jgi:hypothetical protein
MDRLETGDYVKLPNGHYGEVIEVNATSARVLSDTGEQLYAYNQLIKVSKR